MPNTRSAPLRAGSAPQGGPRLALVPTAPAPAVTQPRSGYRGASQARLPAALASAAMVGGLVASLVFMNIGAGHPRKTPALRIVTVPLLAPPPPRHAPAQQAATTPTPPAIVAPPPIVAVPAAAPVLVTAAAPPPPIVATAPPVAAPSATPGPATAASASASVAEGGDLASRMIAGKPPTYPLDARRHREEGTVVLRVLVSIEGLVSEIAVAQSSGSGLLDDAALAAVRKWRWAPLVRDGTAVMVAGRVKIPFVLKR